MELDARLTILKDTGQISKEIHEKIVNIILMFEKKLGIKLTEENGSMLITHLSVALQRIKNGQCVDDSDEEVVLQLKQNKYYCKALDIIKDIENIIDMKIPDNEKNFIVMHLCVLLENEYIKIN